MSRDALLQHALALSPDERVQLIDELLESMVTPGACSELTPEQERELLARFEADCADPTAAISWEEAERRITS